jgi:hypothetical protein
VACWGASYGDRRELVLPDPAEHASDAALVDRPQVIDEGVRALVQTTAPADSSGNYVNIRRSLALVGRSQRSARHFAVLI